MITKLDFVGVPSTDADRSRDRIGGRGVERAHQHVSAGFGHATENRRDLRRCLALGKNYLRHAGAQATVVVNFGKSQVFEGQMAQAIYRIVGREFAAAHLVEEFANGLRVHGKGSALKQPSF